MALSKMEVRENWRRIVKSYYTNILTRPYSVPPLHFNRVPYDVVEFAGQYVLVQRPPGQPLSTQKEEKCDWTSKGARPKTRTKTPKPDEARDKIPKPDIVIPEHVQDDFAQQHVLANLQVLAESRHEPQIIVTELNFKDYMNVAEYSKVTAKLPKKKGQGDYDILIINKNYGILLGELKSIGRTDEKVDDDVLKTRVKKALEQMKKGKDKVTHDLSDLVIDDPSNLIDLEISDLVARRLSIRTCLFLPYISSQQLQRVLEQDQQLCKDLCQVLEAGDVSEAVQLCVCADQLSDPDTFWDITQHRQQQLNDWWQRRMAARDPQPCVPMGDNQYLDIVARFVGPATTVKVHCTVPPRLEQLITGQRPPRVDVRTPGQAVAELGRRLSKIVLTQQQMDILSRNPPLVHIYGPPGTGKTVLLVLQGLRWLREGHDVHIINSLYSGWSVSRVIEKQLQETMAADVTAFPSPGTVHFHQYEFDHSTKADVDLAVRELTAAAQGGKLLCVIMDEVIFYSSSVYGRRTQRMVEGLVTRCSRQQQQLSLWCANARSNDIPACLQQEVINTPLRVSPAVLRWVITAGIPMCPFRGYSDSGLPTPGDGLTVIRLRHAGAGHEGRWPENCSTCGHEVATELNTLGVGSAETCSLRFCDVLIITRSLELHDKAPDDHVSVTSPPCGFVRGLRERGVPVCVLSDELLKRHRQEWERGMADLATASTDHVTVSDADFVNGLERPVVVWLDGRWKGIDDEESDESIHMNDRFFFASRCTSQLIVVNVPKPPRPEFTVPSLQLYTSEVLSGLEQILVVIPVGFFYVPIFSLSCLHRIVRAPFTAWIDYNTPITYFFLPASLLRDWATRSKPSTAQSKIDNSDNSGVSWAKKGFIFKPARDRATASKSSTVSQMTMTDMLQTAWMMMMAQSIAQSSTAQSSTAQSKKDNSGNTGVSWMKRTGFL